MNNVVITSSAADATAAVAVEQHDAQLAGALALHVEALLTAVSRGGGDTAQTAQADLAAWCALELVPHVIAEEQALYPAAQGRTEGRLLVDGMLADRQVISDLVQEAAAAPDPVRAAAAARALQAMFDSLLAKENALVLPLLVGAPDVSVVDLIDGVHQIHGPAGQGDADAGADEHGEPASGSGGHTCSCGEANAPGYPELDARVVPHAIRHATIFGALDAVQDGGGLILIAPHDPLPLLAQVEHRSPGVFAVDYLQRGPEAWRLSFVRSTTG